VSAPPSLPAGRLCLQAPRPAETPRPAGEPGEEEGRGSTLACAFCRRPVTSAASRIAVGGAHEHSCVNPHGLRFRIGCFAEAACRPVGERSDYWTWFPGFTWQIELCPGCREHLGWVFRSSGAVFHGLVLDRLVELPE